MCQKPTTCIHALADNRNQELSFGRFLNHSSVSYGEMLTTTGRFTGECAAGQHVLAIQDSTEFNFPATPTANMASDDAATIVTSGCFCIQPRG